MVLMNKFIFSVFCTFVAISFVYAEAPSITPAIPETSKDDNCYQISSAEELYGFAAIVNGTMNGVERDRSACAKLTKDIVVNEGVLADDGSPKANAEDLITWTPIMSYEGHFDGDGHTISGLYLAGGEKDTVGLFGSVINGTEASPTSIKNVGLVDSYLSSAHISGGIVAISRTDAILSIDEVYSTSTVIGKCAGAIMGISKSGTTYISNVYNVGAVSSDSIVGSLVGVAGKKIRVSNAFSIGTVSGSGETVVGEVVGFLKSGTDASVHNTFILDSFKSKNDTASAKATDKISAESFTNGVVAQALHDYSDKYANGEVWGQKVGSDAHPVFSGIIEGASFSEVAFVTFEGDTAKYFTQYVEGVETALPTPSRKGYSFEGWFENEEFEGDAVESIADTVTGNLTFYAKWEELRCKVSLLINESEMGSVSGDGKYECNTKVTIKATANEGYKFVNWNDLDTSSTRSITVKHDTTFTATFKARTYKVTLHKGGGTLESQLSSYTYGAGAELPQVSRTSYTFDGWYDNSEYTGKAVGAITKTDKGDKEFWAKWTLTEQSSSSSKQSSSSSSKVNSSSSSKPASSSSSSKVASSSSKKVSSSSAKTNASSSSAKSSSSKAKSSSSKTVSSSSKDKNSSSSSKPLSSSSSRKAASSSSRYHYSFAVTNVSATIPELEDGCYKIGSAAELYGFAAVVNGTGTERKQDACGKLTADIIVNEHVLDSNGSLSGERTEIKAWTPIKGFSGTFDGNGKKISGLYIGGNKDSVGLFASVIGGSIEKPVVIKDFGLEDSYFEGSSNVGGIVGVISEGYVSINSVYNSAFISGVTNVGGIVGASNNVVLDNYERKYTLYIYNAYNKGIVEASYAGGGIAGAVGQNVNIANSYHYARVYGSKAEPIIGSNAAGIAISIKNSFFASEMYSSYGGTSLDNEDFTNGKLLKMLKGYHFGDVNGSVWGKDSATGLPTLFAKDSDVGVGADNSGSEGDGKNDGKGDSSNNSNDKGENKGEKDDAIFATPATAMFNVTVTGKKLLLDGLTPGQNIAVFDMQGKAVKSSYAATNSASIDVPRAARYIVRVGSFTQLVNVR